MNWERLFASIVEAYHMTFEEIGNLTIPQLQTLSLKGERECSEEQIQRWADKKAQKGK